MTSVLDPELGLSVRDALVTYRELVPAPLGTYSPGRSCVYLRLKAGESQRWKSHPTYGTRRGPVYVRTTFDRDTYLLFLNDDLAICAEDAQALKQACNLLQSAAVPFPARLRPGLQNVDRSSTYWGIRCPGGHRPDTVWAEVFGRKVTQPRVVTVGWGPGPLQVRMLGCAPRLMQAAQKSPPEFPYLICRKIGRQDLEGTIRPELGKGPPDIIGMMFLGYKFFI